MDANVMMGHPPGAEPDADDRDVLIRRVATLAEYAECVRIERETWGDQFTEQVSATILRIAQEVGGVTAAAFDPTGRILGFVFGLTGVRNGELAHWSDMLAVRPEAQQLGIGMRLKQYQRELLLEIGVGTMYWTYDPLVSRNAHLNLVRIGARVLEYRINYYGEDTGSVVHAGLGTDRFIVAWDLAHTPGEVAPDRPLPSDTPSDAPSDAPIVNAVRPDTGIPTIDDVPDDLPDVQIVRIAIPKDIFAVLAHDPAIAVAWRNTTRRALNHYLSAGYRVTTFRRGGADAIGTYYLRRTDKNSTAHS